MKNALKQIKWLILSTCIIFSIFVSNATLTTGQGQSTPISDLSPECEIAIALRQPCKGSVTPTRPQPTRPQQNWGNKIGNFWNAIARKLNPFPSQGSYEYLILREYGGIFATNHQQIQLPSQVAFNTAAETKAFQNTLNLARVNMGRSCLLQKPAADAFNLALKITRIPLKSGNGASDCLRNFETTNRFWHKYSDHKTLQQIRQGQPKEIMRVVAPPGSSQHLWGLALDLGRLNTRQTQALNQNGWFQTVKGDKPHWTYLGMSEGELMQLGFKREIVGRNVYWLTPI